MEHGYVFAWANAQFLSSPSRKVRIFLQRWQDWEGWQSLRPCHAQVQWVMIKPVVSRLHLSQDWAIILLLKPDGSWWRRLNGLPSVKSRTLNSEAVRLFAILNNNLRHYHHHRRMHHYHHHHHNHHQYMYHHRNHHQHMYHH
jgi:hypothetical protein